ncbi:glycosyltransferase family 2 protein [Burkholderia sp. AU28942]|uniref:glycosyltransferase family 2 protein n=1 Tax=Burkholderia TaxID=32008 RepID=UPI00084159A1|nr:MULTISPECIES: glycosyltransferase family 2 protein [Burkholderia]AOK08187.1 rhamnosyltransferase [Burkholderia latens]MCA8309603.1 glycosyltransferase family 2 protein [Burkholderia sp. AU28942]
MTTLGALVILYHPTDAQLEALAAWRHACDALLVVDNTPRPDGRVRELCARDGIALLHHGNRGGIAGAYNAGLAALFGNGVDAVALFDQDSSVPPGYFATMRGVCATRAARPFLAGPRIFDENAQSFLPELATNGIGLRRLNLAPDAPLQRCAFLISSGCVVSRAAFDVLGRFDEALFIDHVDTEYSFRALARNVPLYVVPSLVLSHRIGAKQRHSFGPFEMTSMNHSWQRRYYSARNAVQLGIQYGLRFPVAIVPNLLTVWQVVQIALVERDKRAKLAGILFGIADGLFGRLGPLERTRPRLAARAQRIQHG